MTKSRDDRHCYVTVQCFNASTGEWSDNARRVTRKTADRIVANLTTFGHQSRIVPNIFYRGVFGPQAERRD